MTNREFLIEWFSLNHPEESELVQSFMDKGVNEILCLIRKYNFGRNHGELDCRFIKWILDHEKVYHEEIRNILKIGDTKVQFTYFGMIFTILKWEGCYVRGKGKKQTPNEISYREFCGELLNLTDRLKSNNVRKTLATPVYSVNYPKDIIRKKNGEKFKQPYKGKLETVYLKILYDMRKELF